MKQVYLIQEGHPCLLLFFAGWAADETPFRRYRPEGMDYAVVYDYRDPGLDLSFLGRYKQVHVVGWSMGVWAAGRVLSALSEEQRAHIASTTAFAGSGCPIDDHEGIPVATFRATLDGLTPASLQKFLRRMCGGGAAYRAFMEVTPRRDFEEIREELRLIGEQYFAQNEEHSAPWQVKGHSVAGQTEEHTTPWRYDQAYIGTADHIFSADNLRAHYTAQGCPDIRTIDCAHYDQPLFHYLLQERWKGAPISKPSLSANPAIDKDLVARRFARARSTYDSEARVQRQVAERTVQLLVQAMLDLGVAPVEVATHFHHIVELGCGPGTLSRQLLHTFRPESLVLNDLCPEMEDCLHDILGKGDADICADCPTVTQFAASRPAVRFQPGDAETLPLPQGTDLIISCSTLQWFASPRAFFQRCRAALQPGGLLVLSTFGPDNLCQTRALTGSGLHYRSLAELCTLLSPYFRLLHTEEEHIVLTFDSPTDVLRHLKQIGATGTDHRLWTPGHLRTFCHDYASRFGSADGHGVGLTYHPIYLLAQKVS